MCLVLLQTMEAMVDPAVQQLRLDLPLTQADWQSRIARHVGGPVRYGAARLVVPAAHTTAGAGDRGAAGLPGHAQLEPQPRPLARQRAPARCAG
jgi:hypothetical protein